MYRWNAPCRLLRVDHLVVHDEPQAADFFSVMLHGALGEVSVPSLVFPPPTACHSKCLARGNVAPSGISCANLPRIPFPCGSAACVRHDLRRSCPTAGRPPRASKTCLHRICFRATMPRASGNGAARDKIEFCADEFFHASAAHLRGRQGRAHGRTKPLNT